MSLIHAIHVHMEGFTAFFKHPLTITGTQISLPCPPYSTILGLISACAGKIVSPKDTRVGYEFRCISTDIELERTNRFEMDDKGMIRENPKGQGILRRYVHFYPVIDLYLTNTSFFESFKRPVSPPFLGRSQDMMWINKVEMVELDQMSSGKIGPTMIPYSQINIPSLVIRCPEYFYNEVKGMTRLVGPVGFYQAILPTTKTRYDTTIKNLYNPSNFKEHDDVIYMHEWLKDQ